MICRNQRKRSRQIGRNSDDSREKITLSIYFWLSAIALLTASITALLDNVQLDTTSTSVDWFSMIAGIRVSTTFAIHEVGFSVFLHNRQYRYFPISSFIMTSSFHILLSTHSLSVHSAQALVLIMTSKDHILRIIFF